MPLSSWQQLAEAARHRGKHLPRRLVILQWRLDGLFQLPRSTLLNAQIGPGLGIDYVLHICPLDSRVFPLAADPSWSVLKLKGTILDKTCMPVQQQYLIHRGKKLHDHETLSQRGVQSGDRVDVVFRLHSARDVAQQQE